MKIKNLYIGDSNQAFVENRFEDGINLIYSNDNNKGKTIVIQSIGYALGNIALFPTRFDYKNYIFILDFEHEGKQYSLLRKYNQFVLKNESNIITLYDESELKHWFDSHIFKLPKIIKNNRVVITDFELFLQVFFLGQDKRDTSRTNSTYFNKNDFISMIHYLCGCSNIEIDDDYQKLKSNLDASISEQKNLLKKTKLIKKCTKEASVITSYSDKTEFISNKQKMDELNKEISSLKNRKNRLYNRISKNTSLISELNSLNTTLDKEGKLICLDCHSTNIAIISKNDVQFDVSTKDMRKQIKNNLNIQNEEYREEINKIEQTIENLQNQLQEILNSPIMNSVNLILYKDDIMQDLNFDKQLVEITDKIRKLKEKYLAYSSKFENNISQQKQVEKELINYMNELYKYFDSSDTDEISQLFTKSSEIYSGSENTLFFISRILSIQKISGHHLPLIIDGFREGEVSTPTEKKLMDMFKSKNNQIILTATLKNEEYHKYDNDLLINRLDYSSIDSKHLLSKKHIGALKAKAKEFGVLI